MRHILILLILIVSCKPSIKQQNKIELVKQYDYYISIQVYGGASSSSYILNNLNIKFFDSTDDRFTMKPLFLYYILDVQKSDSKIHNTDTTLISFSKEQSDSLFKLTSDFLRKVEFDNYDTSINGSITHPFLTHDKSATVRLKYSGKELIATISSIHNPETTIPQLETLLSFLRKFVPPKKNSLLSK